MWDADGAGLAADLTDGGLANGIEIAIMAIDQGSVTLTLEVFDGASVALLTLAGLGAGNFSFLFGDFVGDGGVFDSASAVRLTIEATEAADLALDFVRTIDVPPPRIPEPATLALFGLGLMGLASIRRRRP